MAAVANIRINKAIVLAGGDGKRMKTLTSFSPGSYMGNMPKPALPLVNRPVICRMIDLCVDAGIKDVFVASRYMAGDIVRIVGSGERFGRNVSVSHFVENPPLNTGLATKEIVLNMFKDKFLETDFFLVMPSDICMPHVDLADFISSFKKEALADPKLIGAICFVLRPAEDVINRQPVAVLNQNNRMLSFEEPPMTHEAAKKIFESIGSPEVLAVSDEIESTVFPVNSCIYILSRAAFDAVPEPDNPGDLYDFGKYIFRKMPSKSVLGYFAEEPVLHRPDGASYLLKLWTNLSFPKDLWIAQWRYLLGAKKLPNPNSEYLPDISSFVGRKTRIKGSVETSVIGDHVDIGVNARVERSIIGHGCKLDNVVVSDSLVLPFTYINILRGLSIENISYSVVGGRVVGGTFLDRETTEGSPVSIENQLAAPGQSGTEVLLESLNLSRAYKELSRRVAQISFR